MPPPPRPRQVPGQQVQLFSTRWRCVRGRRRSTRALLFALSFRTLHQTPSLRAPRPSRTAVSALSPPCGGAHSLSPVPLCMCAPRHRLPKASLRTRAGRDGAASPERSAGPTRAWKGGLTRSSAASPAPRSPAAVSRQGRSSCHRPIA